MIDRKTLKSNARAAIRAAKPHPVWVTLLVAAILAVLLFLALQLNGSLALYRSVYTDFMSGAFMESLARGQLPASLAASGGSNALGSLLVIALELMIAVISVGYVLYCLRLSRRMEAGFWNVFDAFGIFLRAVLIRVLKAAAMFLWSMVIAVMLSGVLTMVLTGVLLGSAAELTTPEQVLEAMDLPLVFLASAGIVYVPRFVISYFYRLADYFMLDHPELSCVQCLTMSRLAMRGRKWQLFKLDLSFLGWYLVSLIPFAALWVQPYTAVTQAGFYNETAPVFWQELEQRLRQQAQAPAPTHGYHVPGDPGNGEDES